MTTEQIRNELIKNAIVLDDMKLKIEAEIRALQEQQKALAVAIEKIEKEIDEIGEDE